MVNFRGNWRAFSLAGQNGGKMSYTGKAFEELDVMDDFPRRSRFYQAKLDSKNMDSGERDFFMLPNLYIITLTDYDPFGKNYMMYRISNRCKEIPDLEYTDGLEFIYFYTKGQLGGCKAIKNMLRYLCNSISANVTDEATKELHSYVEKVRVSPEVKRSYMTLEDIIWHENLLMKVNDICELLEEYGEVPADLRTRLESVENKTVLTKLLKLAAKVNSIEEFLNKMNQ